MLTRRRRAPEMMDDPDVDRTDLDRSLRFIRMVNRRLGGAGAVVRHLARWSSRWPAGETIRVIDIGTGSADIPLAITRWAQRAGHRVHVTGVDRHATTLQLAREHVGEVPSIELVQADALQIMDRFEAGTFDYAHAGMFLHHLDDIEVMTALRIMHRLAGRGLIWNDLVRGTVELLLVRLLTLGRPAIVHHDGIASVAAGFTRHEALDLARRVGLPDIAYRRHLFGRFTLTSTKQQ
ncbi:MAG: methyltransferase domain-containing protein, partial [Planctomycetota bacterium]